jgi:hypothetical protein
MTTAINPWAVAVSGEASPPRERLEGSPQQEAFWTGLLDDSAGNLLLDARAGTGKSTSCREGMWRLMERGGNPRIRYCCFNKAIADEFAQKCPPGVDVGTMHRFGMQSLRRAIGTRIEPDKSYLLLDQVLDGQPLPRHVRRSVVRLVSAAKNAGLRPGMDVEAKVEALHDLMDRFEIEPFGFRGKVVLFASLILNRSLEMPALADFDDMLWLPVRLGLAFPRQDFLFIDECLPSWTPVLLADGTSKTIGEVVENKLQVDVLSYDTEAGLQRPCKVIGWSKTPNRKPLVKIKVRWKRKKGSNRPTNFVICTVDHKVWADGKWIPAGLVEPGMTMQVETSAEKSQAGKITAAGRRELVAVMTAKNESGVTGGGYRTAVSPRVRGGNGRGPTLPQSLLHESLSTYGDGWVMEHVVKTSTSGLGYPHHYKIDIACPESMIAVEVDGGSHSGDRREQDRRKDEFLRSRGWKVIRVPNREAVQDTEAVAARILESDCPIGAEVVSVEPVDIPDYHVYDISVEGCHNFYANGILVHNCQDLNPIQHELVGLLAGGGRVIAAGDPYQAIYAFRGADSRSIATLRESHAMRSYPLTVTRRCPRSHVELASLVVRDFEASTDAPEGVVDQASIARLQGLLQPGDLVLCRANRPLISACLKALAARIPAYVRGRAIGDSLMAVLRRIDSASMRTIADLATALGRYEAQEAARLMAKDGSESLLEALSDRVGCLHALAAECGSPAELPGRIGELFDDAPAGSRVTFSSVHRAKGSEARRVHLIDLPHGRPPEGPNKLVEMGQRRNLRYVALTRSLHHLTFVNPD